MRRPALTTQPCGNALIDALHDFGHLTGQVSFTTDPSRQISSMFDNAAFIKRRDGLVPSLRVLTSLVLIRSEVG